MEFKYLNLIYKNLKNLPFEIIKISLLIIIYVICANFFVQTNFQFKSQIFYIFPVFFVISIKNFPYFEKKIYWPLIFFLFGIIDDIIFNRFFGITSIYYLCFFFPFILILRKFRNKTFFFNLITFGLFTIHYLYSVLVSIFFLKKEFFNMNLEIQELDFKKIFLSQFISLIITVLIFFIIQLFLNKKQKTFEII